MWVSGEADNDAVAKSSLGDGKAVFEKIAWNYGGMPYRWLHGMIEPVSSGSNHRVDLHNQGVSSRLIMLVKQVLGPGSSIPDPLPMHAQLSDLGISSLKMVNLMLAVELEFDIAIPQTDITPENFHSLASVEALVVRTLSQRRPT
jgi:acyl carrier protein